MAHGWVYPLPNGAKARCGGPAICPECQREAAALGVSAHTHAERLRAVARAAADYLGWQDGTIPDAVRASGAAHRMALVKALEDACPELVHRAEQKPR